MKRQKTGGRTAGTLNKRSLKAIEISERLKCDPLEILLLFASNNWKALGYESSEKVKTVDNVVVIEPVISPELRAQSAARAISYIYPQLKAIEQQFSEDVVTNITRTILHKQVER